MDRIYIAMLGALYFTGMLQGHTRAWWAWRENALPGCHLLDWFRR